ncbi:MAG: hypothetical protein EOP63_01925 [Sphingomonadales bacterium]|nr:MAG: hypothetical protein EOP63_01925 [Sphingomonadales bacterium]
MQRLIKTAGKLAFLATAATLLTGAQPRLGGLNDRVLASHNRERALAGVPALRWNDELAEGAQAWADHLAATGRFEHSPNIPGRPLEGENIWGGTSGAFRPESMIDLWIAEKKDFVPGVFPANSRTGRPQDVSHYTQLIWGRSGEVGCGLGQNDGEEILVCRYSEPGNVKGRDPFARDWQKEFAKAQSGQSTLNAPLAMSAAGFSSTSSALIEGEIASRESEAASRFAKAPATSSATMRDAGNETEKSVVKASAFISKSIMPSICGWSASNCSWLTD